MACLVTTSFIVPLGASSMLSLSKPGVNQLDFALGRLSSTATFLTVTAQKVLGSCSSIKQVLSVKGNCQHCLMSCARFLHETCSYNLDVNYCSEIVISGYWVGPDADDGWGFVEAVINQMN